MRVRDELKMTIAAYQTLYQSSVTFGMRKQLQSEQGKSELESKIEELQKKKGKLEEKVVLFEFFRFLFLKLFYNRKFLYKTKKMPLKKEYKREKL